LFATDLRRQTTPTYPYPVSSVVFVCPSLRRVYFFPCAVSQISYYDTISMNTNNNNNKSALPRTVRLQCLTKIILLILVLIRMIMLIVLVLVIVMIVVCMY